jgi:hypothetical protein
VETVGDTTPASDALIAVVSDHDTIDPKARAKLENESSEIIGSVCRSDADHLRWPLLPWWWWEYVFLKHQSSQPAKTLPSVLNTHGSSHCSEGTTIKCHHAVRLQKGK